jgi:response regulator of citrate/malate metabolism
MEQIRALIVDDDFVVARVHKGFTDRVEGFSAVGVAHSGREALEAADRLRPDLLILDVYLPDMSGLEVLRELRRRQLPADALIVTAANDVETLQQAMQAGVLHYIIKPFDFARYARTLQNYRHLWLKRRSTPSLRQRDVDEIYAAMEIPPGEELPKGLNRPTLDLVVRQLAQQTEPVSAERLAEGIGVSRSTARRYLEYLTRRGRATLELRYGPAGRPEHRYRLMQ